MRLSCRTARARGGWAAFWLGLAASLSATEPVGAAPLAFPQLFFRLVGLNGALFLGSGATGTATSDLSASLGGSGVFNGAVTIPIIPTTAAPPLTAIQVIITKNASATFTGTVPNKVGGNLAIEGVANVYGICGFPGGGNPLLEVPLVLGTPSTVTKAAGGVAVTAISVAWTAGTTVVTGLPTGTLSPMGTNALTPDGQGFLHLVAPIKIITNIGGPFVAFGSLFLSYVPEPSTLLLLGFGVAALAASGQPRGERRAVVEHGRLGHETCSDSTVREAAAAAGARSAIPASSASASRQPSSRTLRAPRARPVESASRARGSSPQPSNPAGDGQDAVALQSILIAECDTAATQYTVRPRPRREANMRQASFLPILVLITTAIIWTPGSAFAEDAVVADPAHYKVDFENDSVRIVRIKYGPREKSVMHEHPRDGVLVYLTNHRVRFTYPDGKSEEVSARAGQTAWSTAGTHLPENLEAKPLELLYIEIKK